MLCSAISDGIICNSSITEKCVNPYLCEFHNEHGCKYIKSTIFTLYRGRCKKTINKFRCPYERDQYNELCTAHRFHNNPHELRNSIINNLQKIK